MPHKTINDSYAREGEGPAFEKEDFVLDTYYVAMLTY